MPRSPWLASPGCTKYAGVPVLDMVEAILRAMWPDLPMPLTMTALRSDRMRSSALQKIVVDALRERLHGGGFDVEHLACKVERTRCGGEWFIHAQDYSSVYGGGVFLKDAPWASSGHEQFHSHLILTSAVPFAVGVVVLCRILRLPAMLGYLLVGITDRSACAGLDTRCAGNAPSGRIRRGVPDVQHRSGIQFGAVARHAAPGVRPGYGAGRRNHAAGDAASLFFGLDWRAGLALGGMLAMSSTAIVSKMLVERAELNTPHGQKIMGVLLFQDLAVVPLIIIIPGTGTQRGDIFPSPLCWPAQGGRWCWRRC